MRALRFSVLVLATTVVACSGGDDDDSLPKERDAGPTASRDGGPTTNRDGGPITGRDGGTESDGGVVITDCAPALNVDPSNAAVLPFGLYTIVPEGGTGDYRFEIETNNSGAIVNELSGAYLAGGEGGAIDTVVVTDVGCIGEARIDIRVVEPLQIRPFAVTAAPGTSWTFEGVGGTGNFTYAVLIDGSGGTLSPTGAYTAGNTEGTDRIELRDTETGQTSEATVIVSNAATMAPSPPFVFLPVGNTFELEINGGSGFVEVVENVTNFSLIDGRTISGDAPGKSQVTLRDLYTGQTAPFAVGVAGPQQFTPTPWGQLLGYTFTRAAGDLNGDGFEDIVVSSPEATVNGYLAGAVFVYQGNNGGFDPTPVQVLTGENRRDYYGNGVAVADFDGDGENDLLVGAPRSDNGGTDIGAAFIYKGLPGGFFDTTPWRTLPGRFSFDYYGWAVTTCDFDDDGREDIAIGGYLTEDRVRAARTNDQGGVFIYLNKDTGFSDIPDQELWGDVPDGMGGWNGRAMRLGAHLAAGDVDGDGTCDLVAGAHEWDRAANTNDGLFYVYKGGPMGLSSRPYMAVANDNPADPGGQFARRIAVADMNNDGRAEIAVGNYGFDAGSSDQHGAVRVYLGRELTGPVTALASYRPADFEYEHPQNQGFDQIGWSVAIGDVTGDGVPDLLSGNYSDEAPMGQGNAGTIRIWAGRANALPDPAVEPVIIGGVMANDRLGADLAIIPDVDGDGRDDVVSFAAYADNFGVDFGAPYVVTTADTPVLTVLEQPAEPSGNYFGYAAAIVGDVTGDGFEDMVVGAPQHPSNGRLSGTAYLYRGTATGFEDQPALTLSGFRQHSGSDYFGWGVGPAGDFDGDGVQDFAIVARFDDRPSTFDTNVFAPEMACSGSSSNPGAVFIWRGVSLGLPFSEPSFIYFGPVAGDGVREVAGDFDFNGDGYDDIIVGSLDIDTGAGNRGGAMLVRGRPADGAGRITVICQEDLITLGRAANDQMGFSVTGIGDLNGDGCDESAAGAPFNDATQTNEGEVRVLFGWGGAGCPAAPTMIALRSNIRNAQGGYGVFSQGVDLDGDTIPELAMGVPGLPVGGNTTGGAIVAYGAYLAGLPTEPVADVPTSYQLMIDTTRPPLIAVGRTAGENAGRSVALIGGGMFPGALVLGGPQGNQAGVALSGGAMVYAYTAMGLTTAPAAAFGGETTRLNGSFGRRVHGGTLNGAPAFVVGGFDGSSMGLDSGSAYVVDFNF